MPLPNQSNASVLLAALVATSTTAQQPGPGHAPELGRWLSVFDDRDARADRVAHAIERLRAAGQPAAIALIGRIQGAARAGDLARVARLADALAALGRSAAPAVPSLVKLFPTLPEGDGLDDARSAVLRAIGTGVLWVDDDAVADRAHDALRKWARDSLCYSPAADRPSLAWCEYVRAIRRAKICGAGTEPAGLTRSLELIHGERQGMGVIVVGFGGGNPEPPAVHDLTSFGRHGTRHELEAIAEACLDTDPPPRAVVDELARYLEFEKPRRLELRTDGHAGIGEPFPANPPPAAGRFPVRWRDDYRFALSRAVLAQPDQPQDRRRRAAEHLLYGDRPTERLRALELLRDLAPAHADTVTHLTAQLEDPDRGIVREAITSLGIAGRAAASAIPTLERFAEGDDRELSARAGAALRRIRRN